MAIIFKTATERILKEELIGETSRKKDLVSVLRDPAATVVTHRVALQMWKPRESRPVLVNK